MPLTETELEYNSDKGECFIGDNSVLVLSRGNLAELQREFKEVIGPAAHSIIYKSGKEYAGNVESNIKRGIAKLLSKLSMESVAEKMLEQFKIWGYGKPELIEVDKSKNHAVIRVENSANAEGYEDTDEPVCHFTRGVIAGAAEILFGESVECKETRCIAKGDPYCEFRISRRSQQNPHGNSR